MTTSAGAVAAYRLGAPAWASGPERVYDRLAEVLVGASPVPLRDRVVLDVGAGTGAGSRAATAAGAFVVGVDLAPEMLAVDAGRRPPGVAADLCHLPFAAGVDVVLAPFCCNHLPDPAVGVREAGRVAPWLLASSAAAEDDHPARVLAEQALTEAGWERPRWYDEVRRAMGAWGSVDRVAASVRAGGLVPVTVERRAVGFEDLGVEDLVAWRLGMPQCAGFLAALGPGRAAAVARRAATLLAGAPPLVRHVVLVAARRP